MSDPLMRQVLTLYERFDPALIAALDQIYHTDVVFEDPVHRVQGVIELRRYFSRLVRGLDECRFEFTDVLEQSGSDGEPSQAVLLWIMHYRHPKLRGGKLLTLAGSSHLKYSDRVLYHRDYFDVGAMLYEQLPLLGGIIRAIKRRLG